MLREIWRKSFISIIKCSSADLPYKYSRIRWIFYCNIFPVILKRLFDIFDQLFVYTIALLGVKLSFGTKVYKKVECYLLPTAIKLCDMKHPSD